MKMKELDMQQPVLFDIHEELSEEEIERALGAFGTPHNPIDTNRNLDANIRNQRLKAGGIVGTGLTVLGAVGYGIYKAVKH
jgi:predicted aconitase